MADPRVQGPLSALAVSVSDPLQKYQALPLDKKSEARTSAGAFLLAIAGYTAATLGPYADRFPQAWVLGWFGCAGVGLLLLIIGIRGPRGQRDPMTAIVALAVPVGGGIAMMKWLPGAWDNFFVRGFCIAVLASCAVRFWMATRSAGANAQKIVRQQIAQNEINWRAVGRR